MSAVRVGVITCSDRCTRGEAVDTSGPALAALSAERGWEVLPVVCVFDDAEAIKAAIVEMADVVDVDLVLTTGGTGLSPRDVTPEATLAVCPREAQGIAEAIRAESLRITGRAMLSRGRAAVRGTTLVVNLPGSEKAARETFSAFADQVEHAVQMMAGSGH
ncbi:MAG: MogA/MoaB family molybdenum cofactor biosynthesis protein [Coriobacteriia bacterium]|nr:MogA/MoaB family molybdenum cofactor biosynthesis protein [Coriobacteriia bacterium]